jgi:hypothetical protein
MCPPSELEIANRFLFFVKNRGYSHGKKYGKGFEKNVGVRPQ